MVIFVCKFIDWLKVCSGHCNKQSEVIFLQLGQLKLQGKHKSFSRFRNLEEGHDWHVLLIKYLLDLHFVQVSESKHYKQSVIFEGVHALFVDNLSFMQDSKNRKW